MNPYYADDLVTLYLGDCRDVDAWLVADVLVTDPPYGVAYASGQMSRAKQPRVDRIVGDETTDLRDEALRMWGARPAVVFGTWKAPRPPDAAHRLIWHKRRQPPAMSSAPWYSADEEIYLLGSGWTGVPRQNVIVTDEWRSGRGFVRQSGHPTPKPDSLMSTLIAKCPPGMIADPFAGSGSTLVAAKALGRACIGVELEERYCELAARRLSQGVLDFGEVSA